ncbi:MAG: hypothetical protein KC940_17805 [Candidatus Omnitrophica bacterium]|nr:hypothetical protein [Candidatus Omnitrophota bacterium]MCA9432372.1 hypothetical protein [Candidatus Omnitrophota bacterium]MCA9434518.1 hypothetical protein [Candidatus Omnitrophota bacterium]MCA9439720.1 hypothetical protein [Candidatus Omnitrophota bacterium]MCB9767028.1 hypothetical protein [Candidatus Omnitrophota bacterium]
MNHIENPVRDEPRRHPLLWVFALFCLFLSVPFYYPEGRAPTMIFGLPDWCWVTLIADILFALIVCWMILKTWIASSEED